MPFAIACLCATTPCLAPPQGTTRPEIVPREWLAIDRVDDIRSRRPFRTDAVFRRYLLDPASAAPVQGETVVGENGEGTWERVEADENGRLPGNFGYSYCEFEVEQSTFALARLLGAATLFLDGSAHAGDYYRLGFGGVPVELEAGHHRVFVTGYRGSHELRFTPIEEGLVFADWDSTLPHLVVGREPEGVLGVTLLNASRASSGPLVIEYGGEGPVAAGRVAESSGIVPLGALKLALPLSGSVVSGQRQDTQLVPVRVLDGADVERLSFGLKLEQLEQGERVTRTYLSMVDGSAQPYSILPPAGEPSDEPMKLALALHGAAVHCWGQAGCYPQTPDFWVVAPNNRRKFGFDFQDWGRRDVYDVLAEALALSGVDRSRVFVTGHSMGGHGTWHLVANDADGFAGCAPAAAWESFDSYSGRPVGQRFDLWSRADASSLTLSLIDNLRQTPAYILHGTRDTNVPVGHALTMIEALTKAGGTFRVHMQGGAGHGFGNGRETWLEAFEFFRGRQLPNNPPQVDFTTVDPAVDARHHWLRVEQPLEYGKNTRVHGGMVEERLELTTANARVIGIEKGAPEAAGLVIDGSEVSLEGRGWPLWLELRTEGGSSAWHPREPPEDGFRKGPRRSGPFKRAFDRRFLFVVGTGGSADQDGRLLARARYDAGIWSYRANGRAEIVSDQDFLRGEFADRSLILYGSRTTNAAWGAALPDSCPIDVAQGELSLRGEVQRGEDLAALFVYPRAESDTALVGVFAGTGPPAHRLGFTLMPFVSGVGYPDYVVFDSRVLSAGDGGVLHAGWFDADWR